MLEPLDMDRALGRLCNGLPERYKLSLKTDWKKLSCNIGWSQGILYLLLGRLLRHLSGGRLCS